MKKKILFCLAACLLPLSFASCSRNNSSEHYTITQGTDGIQYELNESKDGYIVYEVKFTNSKIDNKIVKEEISQIAETNLNPINFGFVSKSGFDISNDNNYILISLDDIYY